MNELELVENCKKENNFARKRLYEIYSPLMMGICLRYCGDFMTAQDLLHDGFIKVFESIHSFVYRGNGSLKGWLSTVFANSCLEYLRKNSVFQGFLSIDDVTEPATWPTEDDYIKIPNDVLMDFILELPAGYRAVFNMYAMEEMSHKEIGAILGINESSSRSQLARAKNLLVEKINDYIKKHE